MWTDWFVSGLSPSLPYLAGAGARRATRGRLFQDGRGAGPARPVQGVLAGAALEGETAVLTGGVLAHQGLLPLAGAMAAGAIGSFLS